MSPATSAQPTARSSTVIAGKWILIIALAAVAYFVLNPSWYGDAPWYAIDMRSSSRGFRHDSGHLIWRPLGWALWRIGTLVVPGCDPLSALRVLSSVFTAGLVLATFKLGRLCGIGNAAAGGAATLVAVSNFALSYGGSGCSYTAAAFASLLGVTAFLGDGHDEWGIRQLLIGATCVTISWCLWGTAIVAVPAASVASALASKGNWSRRLSRGLLTSVTIGLEIGAIAWTYYRLFVSGVGGAPFLIWLRSSGHGLDPRLSITGGFRAVYGFVVGLIYLDEAGRSLKGLLLSDGALVDVATLAWTMPTMAAALGLLVIVATRCARKLRSDAPRALRVLGVATAVLIPNAGFAALWQGADLERYAYSVPFVCLVIAYAFSGNGNDQKGRQSSAVHISPGIVVTIACLAVMNLGAWVIPTLASRGGDVGNLTASAKANTRDVDVLVVAGQRLGAHTWSAVSYLSNRKI